MKAKTPLLQILLQISMWNKCKVKGDYGRFNSWMKKLFIHSLCLFTVWLRVTIEVSTGPASIPLCHWLFQPLTTATSNCGGWTVSFLKTFSVDFQKGGNGWKIVQRCVPRPVSYPVCHFRSKKLRKGIDSQNGGRCLPLQTRGSIHNYFYPF